MIAFAQVGDHENAPPVCMPACDIGRVDPRVAAVVPHQFRHRARCIDDIEPSLGAGVGHLIHQQASLRRPLVVADSAGAWLFERNHLDLAGIDAKQSQRSPLVLVAGISTAQLVHRRLGAEIVGERHFPQSAGDRTCGTRSSGRPATTQMAASPRPTHRCPLPRRRGCRCPAARGRFPRRRVLSAARLRRRPRAPTTRCRRRVEKPATSRQARARYRILHPPHPASAARRRPRQFGRRCRARRTGARGCRAATEPRSPRRARGPRPAQRGPRSMRRLAALAQGRFAACR